MVTSYVAVGSNLGNRRSYINKAIELLKGLKGITVKKASSIYETNPVGGLPNQNKFLNSVIEIKTSISPSSLLRNLKQIEKELMRTGTVKNGPRTIDLDILTYGDEIIKKPNLLIPHPRFDKRDFVLKGFSEIAPDFIHPVLKNSIKNIYKKSKINMKVIKSVSRMSQYAFELRRQGKKIGFVPTMGYLHDGHLKLIKKAKKENDIVVISIFVNPAQFGPKEDFKKYPRDFKRDKSLLQSCDVDIVFCPNAKDIYPKDYRTYVNVEGLTEVLCGASRPGHFRGVSTIVAKLINIVQPHIAYFGQKDAQQAVVIKQMATDLNMPLEIKVLPTLREKDGLAMSSRNVYLSGQGRKDALILYQSLVKAKKLIKKGERNACKIKAIMKSMIKNKKTAKIDYVSIVDAKNLNDVKIIRSKVLIALAVKIGTTRLIDNIVVRV